MVLAVSAPHEYELGEEAISSHIAAPGVKRLEAETAASLLREGDSAFIKRSDGSWRYGIVAKTSLEDASFIEFLVNRDGSIKRIRRKHWGSCIRTLKNDLSDQGEAAQTCPDGVQDGTSRAASTDVLEDRKHGKKNAKLFPSDPPEHHHPSFSHSESTSGTIPPNKRTHNPGARTNEPYAQRRRQEQGGLARSSSYIFRKSIAALLAEKGKDERNGATRRPRDSIFPSSGKPNVKSNENRPRSAPKSLRGSFRESIGDIGFCPFSHERAEAKQTVSPRHIPDHERKKDRRKLLKTAKKAVKKSVRFVLDSSKDISPSWSPSPTQEDAYDKQESHMYVPSCHKGETELFHNESATNDVLARKKYVTPTGPKHTRDNDITSTSVQSISQQESSLRTAKMKYYQTTMSQSEIQLLQGKVMSPGFREEVK